MDSVTIIFDFIVSIFDTIVNGINSCISIVTSIINLIFSVVRIFPSPLYECTYVFISLYLVIFIYKVFRKG